MVFEASRHHRGIFKRDVIFRVRNIPVRQREIENSNVNIKPVVTLSSFLI